MKKTIMLLSFVLIINLVFLSYSDLKVEAENNPNTWQESISMANKEIGFDYYKINGKDLLDTLNINSSLAIGEWGSQKTGFIENLGCAFVYGEPFGDVKSGKNRYLGKSFYGEIFTNTFFPSDKKADKNLENIDWIVSPWGDKNISWKIKNYALDSFRDSIKNKYLPSMLEGIKISCGINQIPLGSNWQTSKPWEKIIHVLQPPTYFSHGMGIMWHDPYWNSATNKWDAWYITVPLVPLKNIQEKITPEPIITPVTTPEPTPSSSEPKKDLTMFTALNSGSDGCFLDLPQLNETTGTVETYIIKGFHNPINQDMKTKVKVWLFENMDENISFTSDNMLANYSAQGKIIFDDYATFTVSEPFWVKKIEYKKPNKNKKSGIVLQSGQKDIDKNTGVHSWCWITGRGTYLPQCQTTSDCTLMDWLPWNDIEAKYKIKRATE
jgi:hypothetical protein